MSAEAPAGGSRAPIAPGTRVGHVHLKVADLERSIAFCSGVLGFEVTLRYSAFLYPTRPDLADALRRLLEAGIPLTGASDHGVSEALYLDDPDGNGVELYWDRPEEDWPRRPDGGLEMFARPLDLDGLVSELDGYTPPPRGCSSAG